MHTVHFIQSVTSRLETDHFLRNRTYELEIKNFLPIQFSLVPCCGRMKSVSVLFFTTTIWLAHADNSFLYRLDYEYYQAAGGWLKFHRVPANFTDAFLRCKAEGSTVASPLTPNLQDVMMSLFKNNSDSCAFFTGVHAVYSKGDFAAVEGVPLNKLPVKWAPGEPDNHENSEDCTVMLENGTLADVRCNETYPYICYKKWTVIPPMTPCGTVDQGYFLDTRTGSCYKFHNLIRTWRRAYMTCMAEGGYLAIINSPTEVQVIKDIFAKYPSDIILSEFKDVVSIGFYSWGEHGNWYTVHGESLVEAGYATFGSRQSTAVYGTLCGGIKNTGLLYDLYCDIGPLSFICEKDPNI